MTDNYHVRIKIRYYYMDLYSFGSLRVHLLVEEDCGRNHGYNVQLTNIGFQIHGDHTSIGNATQKCNRRSGLL